MARRRYISTKISTDKVVNRLAVECGDFAALLYTWLIPHAEDDCSLLSDPEEILMRVMPGRKDKTAQDVEVAINAIVSYGLLEYDASGVLRFKPSKFYEYQSYIKAANRVAANTEDDSKTPENTDERRKTPENAVSPPPPPPLPPPFTPSHSHSLKDNDKAAKTKKKDAEREIDPFMEFSVNPELRKALSDFNDMRNKIKDPMTQRAKQILLTELTKLSTDTETQIAILDQAVLRNWKSVYPLKEPPKEKDDGIDLDRLFEVAAKKGLEGASKLMTDKGG